MKLLSIIIMLAALYLLYRIAYPKQSCMAKEGDGVPEKEEKAVFSVMGKSHFVLPDRSKPMQTPATQTDIEKDEEKSYIFVAETGDRSPAAIPANELDEVFGESGNPAIISIPLDTPDSEVENDIDLEAEEAEELGRIMGGEAVYADGHDFDDLQTVAQAIRERPETVSEQTGKTLVALEHTELPALLAGDEESKMSWIKSIIDRHVQSTTPETEIFANTDYGDFEIVDFLS
jgi:hypothetical protein